MISQWLSLRSALVPFAAFGSQFSYIVFFFGLFFASMTMVKAGILLFSAAVAFSLVTMHVELFNADGSLGSEAEVTYRVFPPEVAARRLGWTGIEAFHRPRE